MSLISLRSLSDAGWLLWESPALIPDPKDEKIVSNPDGLASEIPSHAANQEQTIRLHLDFLWAAKQKHINKILENTDFTEVGTGFFASISDALKEASSGKTPVKFPPANKWFIHPIRDTPVKVSDKNAENIQITKAQTKDSLQGTVVQARPVSNGVNKKLQDLSFARNDKDKRIELYFWRLPYKTKEGLPLWCSAAYSIGKSLLSRDKETKITEDLTKEIEKSHPNLKIRKIKDRKSKRKIFIIEIRIPRPPKADTPLEKGN
ncbi:MAG: hypothetical protein HY746_08995 [Elusimicrobia bacterium]|nr:hypothetical protein [Elusimicrobiota bacterium]